MEFSSDDEDDMSRAYEHKSDTSFGDGFGDAFDFMSFAPAAAPPLPMQLPFGANGGLGGDNGFAHDFHAEPLSVISVEVTLQPPSETRTRTPNDKRTFNTAVRLQGAWREHGVTAVGVELVFAPDRSHPNYEPAPDKLLGGPALVVQPNDDDGSAQFTLWLWEPSAKHNEREFAIRFVPLNSDKEPVAANQRFVSSSFYAFSHARVLKRRRDVYLRAINKPSTSAAGGERMFVVGRGFIDSPTLAVVVQSAAGGEQRATQIEFWSECVLFFTVPALNVAVAGPDGVMATVLVSNDGRSMSNALELQLLPPAEDPGAYNSSLRARF